MVEVHEDRVVISNPGGIPAGMDIKDLMKGVSKRRNELIADIFARMHVAERMGSGLKRIARLLKDADQPLPEIDSNLFFKITFKRPFYSEKNVSVSPKSSEKPESSSVKNSVYSSVKGSVYNSVKELDDTAQKILQEIKKNQDITAKQLAEKLKITLRTAEKQLAKLKSMRILKRLGSRKLGHWEIVGSEKDSEKTEFGSVKSSVYSSVKGSVYDTVKELDETAQKILQEIRKDPETTAREIAKNLSLALRTVEKQLAKLKAAGILERIGARKHGHWQIIEKEQTNNEN